LRNEHPDQPRAQVHALVPVGEPLMSGQADHREAIGQLPLDAHAEERMRGRALESAPRLDQVAGREELDPGTRGGAQTPRGIADQPRVAVHAHDSRFGDGAGQRDAVLSSPQNQDRRRIAAPSRLRVARRLRGDARVSERRRGIEQHTRAQPERVEMLRVAGGADVAEAGRLRTGNTGDEDCEQRGEQSHFVPQLLRKPRNSETYPAALTGCRIRLYAKAYSRNPETFRRTRNP